MEKMVSPKGVKANLCCASCVFYSRRPLGGLHRFDSKEYCVKRKIDISGDDKCHSYVMGRFFRERGYKIIKE